MTLCASLMITPMSYTLSEIHPDDHRGMAQVRNLLEQEGIRRDGNLDYTCGIFNDDWELAGYGVLPGTR